MSGFNYAMEMSNNAVSAYNSGLVPASSINGKIQHPCFEPNPKAMAAVKEYYRDARKETETKVYKNCRVEWLEWGGTKNHPTCKKMTADNCVVTVKGQTAEVKTPDGKIFIKRLYTNGFSFAGNQENNLMGG